MQASRKNVRGLYAGGFVLLILLPVVVLSIMRAANNSSNKIDNPVSTSKVYSPTHYIQLSGGGNLNVRNRALSVSESLLLASEPGGAIHNSTWQETLYDGQDVQLLETHGIWHKIRYKSRTGKYRTGYINASFKGLPTLFEK